MKSQCCFSTGHEVFPWFRGIYIYIYTYTLVSSQDVHTGGKIDRGSTKGVAMGSSRIHFPRELILKKFLVVQYKYKVRLKISFYSVQLIHVNDKTRVS